MPLVAVIGDNEVDAGTVAVRSRKDGDLGTMTIDEFAALRKHEQERS